MGVTRVPISGSPPPEQDLGIVPKKAYEPFEISGPVGPGVYCKLYI